MRVTLAMPHDGHAPGETVDLPDDVARTLIGDGYARAADLPAPPLTAGEPEAAEPESTDTDTQES